VPKSAARQRQLQKRWWQRVDEAPLRCFAHPLEKRFRSFSGARLAMPNADTMLTSRGQSHHSSCLSNTVYQVHRFRVVLQMYWAGTSAPVHARRLWLQLQGSTSQV